MSTTTLFDEWDTAISELCAGYDKPCTNERRSAYRRSLKKMHIVAWQRLVEHCLSEKGPEKFPTTGQLWQISRELKRTATRPAAVQEDDAEPMSKWAVKANLALLRLAYFDSRRGFEPLAVYEPPPAGGYGDASYTRARVRDRSHLDHVLAVKRRIVSEAEAAEASGDPWRMDEFADVLVTALEQALGSAASGV